ncbi:hypothetical protein, partial [Thiolapillus sp.]|uniref:hypothetical protein n=1 Tax=Thiolapillus sp. TaxID=2017437 RepID=UPI003AF73602
IELAGSQVCLRPRDRFWDIPVPKIDSAFDNLFVPQPSWSPSTTQQLRKLVAAPYLAPNDWTPRSEAYFVFPLAQGTPGKQCGLAATGVYQPSLRSPWLAAIVTFWAPSTIPSATLVTVKLALLCPACKVTAAGTSASVTSLLSRYTDKAFVRSPDRFRVAVAVLPSER